MSVPNAYIALLLSLLTLTSLLEQVGLTQRPLGPMMGRSVLRPTAVLTPRSITPRAGVKLRAPRPRSLSRCSDMLHNAMQHTLRFQFACLHSLGAVCRLATSI